MRRHFSLVYFSVNIYRNIFNPIYFKLIYIFLYALTKLLPVIWSYTFCLHIPPCKLLCQNIKKHCVLIIHYRLMYSSINNISLEEIPEEVYTDARIFHTSGISLALSANTRAVAIELIKKFKAGGAAISFDINYRANLWSEDEARETIQTVLPYVDILFISEETSRRMFRKTGDLRDIMKSYCAEYGVRIVATTQRTVISPKIHTFGSILYSREADAFYTEPPYENIDVVDRLGSGDAYVAGVLFGLLQYNDPRKALEFGNATSSVKNTIPGDLPSSDFKEIASIIASHKSTGPQSELNR